MTEGEPSSEFIIVLDGLLEVRVGGSYERRIATVGPGELVGEMQLLGESVAAATVLPLENSLLPGDRTRPHRERDGGQPCVRRPTDRHAVRHDGVNLFAECSKPS